MTSRLPRRVAFENAVTDAPDGLDQLWPPELLAQLRHVDVDGARPGCKGQAPNTVEQPIPGYHMTCVSRQLDQELELQSPQAHRSPGNRDSSTLQVNS